MPTTPAFATTTVPLTASTGDQTNIKVAVLPGGNLAVAHAFVDSSGAMLDPAKDSTVQAATAAILAATASLLPQT